MEQQQDNKMNLILISIIYEVTFPDCQVRRECIAKNMMTTDASDGHSNTLKEGMVDFVKDQDALEKAEQHVKDKRGQEASQADYQR